MSDILLTKFEEGQKIDFSTFLQKSIENAVIKFVSSQYFGTGHDEHSLKTIVSGLLYPHYSEYNAIYTPRTAENSGDVAFDITIHYKDHDGKVRSFDYKFNFERVEDDDTSLEV